MSAEQETTDAGGLSRRQLVARGAIAGGLVWAAPIIRTTAAYATTANGTEKPCKNFFMVVINPAGQVLPAPARIEYHTTPPAMRRWFRDNPGVTVQYPSVPPQLTAVSDEQAAVLLPAVTGPNAAGRQCRMVLGFARKGEDSFAEAFIDPDPPIAVAVGRRLIFPCPAHPSSHADALVAPSVGGPTDASTTTSSSTTTTTSTTPSSTAGTDAALGGDSASLGADGSATSPVGSDGSANPTLGSDGQRSSGGSGGGGTDGGGGDNGGGTDDHGNGNCFNALYLIYCCPR